jgi:hypothetical protein
VGTPQKHKPVHLKHEKPVTRGVEAGPGRAVYKQATPLHFSQRGGCDCIKINTDFISGDVKERFSHNYKYACIYKCLRKYIQRVLRLVQSGKYFLTCSRCSRRRVG